jgi:hypothetical protein
LPHESGAKQAGKKATSNGGFFASGEDVASLAFERSSFAFRRQDKCGIADATASRPTIE